MSHRSNRTIAMTTLGCKVNQADSDHWLAQFVDRGYEIVDFDQAADAYVVNTCTVTHVADRKSRHLLRQARRQNPAALVVAAGCYAAVAPNELARMAEVDLVIGDADKPRLVDLVHERLEGHEEQPLETLGGGLRDFGARHRAFLKVSDGCNKFCAFCIVPYARGRERSAAPDDVIRQIGELAAAGYREVVLTAVHMGTYGRDRQLTHGLRDLVERALVETSIERLRLSSIEPEDFDDGLLPLWQDRRLCRHFHLALDSGSDPTLKRMRRRYTAAEYATLIQRIRAAIPEVAITTDVMVGFPGETDAEFAESHRFVAAQGFAGIHVFPYSSRRRTTASKLPDQISPEVKRERTAQMLELAADAAQRFRAGFVGQVVPVLYEGPTAGSEPVTRWEGLTDNYLRVRTASPGELSNRILATRLISVADDCLNGELLDPLPAAGPVKHEKGQRLRLTAISR